MGKIFRRPTQSEGKAKRKRNEKNRTRNINVNFRVSPVEKELLDARIAVCGLTKSEFFIQSCLYQTILVKGNIRAFSEINKKLAEIAEKIDSNLSIEDLDPEQVESLKTILEILYKMYG